MCDLRAFLDEDLFVDLMNNYLNASEFTMSIGTTATSNPQDVTDCDLFDSHISATYVECAKGSTKNC